MGHAVTRKNNTLCTYAVAIYKPNGNVLGKFADNVQQGSFEKEKYCKAPLIDIKKAKRTKTSKASSVSKVFIVRLVISVINEATKEIQHGECILAQHMANFLYAM